MACQTEPSGIAGGIVIVLDVRLNNRPYFRRGCGITHQTDTRKLFIPFSLGLLRAS